MKFLSIFMSAFILFGLNLIPVSAAEFRTDQNLQVIQEIVDDSYLMGNEVHIQKMAHGDVTLFAGNSLIDEGAQGDVNFLGGTLGLKGNYGDDIRIIGQKIIIDGKVTGDIFILANEVKFTDNAQVFGEVYVQAMRADITGTFHKLVNISAVNMFIDADIQGKSSLVSKNMQIGENAHFSQDIEYWNEKGKVDFEKHMTAGKITMNEGLKTRSPFFFAGQEHTVWSIITNFLTVLLLIAVFTFIPRKSYDAIAHKLHDHFAESFGWGVLYLLAIPMLSLVLCATVIALPFGLFLAILYGFSLYCAFVLVSLVLAAMTAFMYKQKWNRWMFIAVSFVFYLVFGLITQIPVLGFFAMLVVVAAVFGAVKLVTSR